MKVAPIARYYKYKDSDRIFAHYCQSCTSKLPQGYNPPNTYSSAMKDSKFPSYQAQYKRQYNLRPESFINVHAAVVSVVRHVVIRIRDFSKLFRICVIETLVYTDDCNGVFNIDWFVEPFNFYLFCELCTIHHK